jgi:hypothetical protein
MLCKLKIQQNKLIIVLILGILASCQRYEQAKQKIALKKDTLPFFYYDKEIKSINRKDIVLRFLDYNEEIKGVVIRYGSSGNYLSEKVTIGKKSLKIIAKKDNHTIYECRFKPALNSKGIFLNLKTLTNKGESETSAVFKVES